MAGEAVYTPTPADYVDANRLALRSSKRHRRVPCLGVAAVVLAGSIVIGDRWAGKTFASALDDAVVPLAGALALLLLPFVWRYQVPRTVAKQFAQRPEMAAPIQLSWTSERISFAAASGTSIQRWDTLHRWLVNETTFMLLPTDGLMLPVPRRAVSVEAWADLVATAKQYGPPAG